MSSQTARVRAQQATPPRARIHSWLSGALFALLVAFVVFTFQDYGMSWDEQVQHTYGKKVLSFYTSAFADRSALTWSNLFYYGGCFEVLAAIVTRLFPLDPYDLRHLLGALVGVAGIGGAWRLSHLLGGPRAAFFTAILLATYPAYYGHSFINSKDIPFAALYIWSLYYLIRLVDELPSVSVKMALKLGVATGLAMGVRVGGLLLLCYLFAIQGAFLLTACATRKSTWHELTRLFGKQAATTGLTTAVAYSLMLSFWPYALSKPIRGPMETLAWFSSDHDAPSAPEYVPLHLLFKLPELVLLLILVGASLAIIRGIRRRRRLRFREHAPYAVLVLATAFPPIYAALKGAYLHDEIRHFLFIIPPLFCLVGLTSHRILEQVRHSRLALSCGALAMAAHLASTTWFSIRLHPYEYGYYNSLIGGVRGAYQSGYAVEYWASSYREGVRRLERYLRRRDGTGFENEQYQILVGPAHWCATHYFPPNFVRVTDVEEADVYLSVNRWEAPDAHQGEEIFAVGRFGVPFTVAKRLEPPAPRIHRVLRPRSF